MLAGATDEETFKVVPLYKFKRSAVTKFSSVLESSTVLAAASVVLPTSNAIPVVPARETIPVPAEILFCNKNLLAVRSIAPPVVDTESAMVSVLPGSSVSTTSPPPNCLIPKPDVVRSFTIKLSVFLIRISPEVVFLAERKLASLLKLSFIVTPVLLLLP